MEYQAGLDGWIYKEAQPGYFQLVGMDEEEFEAFKQLVSGNIHP